MSSSSQWSAKWYVMAAVAMGVFLATIDGSIVNIALPTLERELHVDFSAVQWVVLAYLLTVTTLMLGIGRLADMIGKKKIYLLGFLIFTIGSALCGLVNRIELLIGFRILQGIGAAMMMALGTAIVTEAFPPQERGKALGIMGSTVSIGVIIGPTLGGLILEAATWQWLFFVNVPVGMLGIWMVHKFVPEIRPIGNEPFDLIGGGLLFVALFSLLLGLSFSQQSGFNNVSVIGLLGAALIAIGVFIRVELNQKYPMIDLRLFKSVLLSINLATGYLTFICSSGILLIMPFYLQNILKFSPREAGMLMSVVPLIVGFVAPLAGNISDRVGPRILTSVGLFVLILGFISVSTMDANTSALGYALHFLPVGLGLGLFQSPNNSAIMGTAPRNRLGIVSGLLSITRTLGQVTGIAILGAVWTARVLAYDGSTGNGDVTQASIPAQISGLHETMHLVIGLLVVAFLLSLWALYKDSSQKAAARSLNNRAAPY